MKMKNNIGLVNHVKMALNEKWGYVWGTFGEVLTVALLHEKATQYPNEVGHYIDFIRDNLFNRRTVDCIGLIKSYLWWNGSEPQYNPNTDISADDMFNCAESKGFMNTFPTKDTPGLLVWKSGHIGVYIGNGQVIESHGTLSGVIQTPLKGSESTEWSHWLKCPSIVYEEEKFVHKTYVELVNEASNGRAEDWVKAINTAVACAEADGSLGELEIFKFLPQLIENIGNKK